MLCLCVHKLLGEEPLFLFNFTGGQPHEALANLSDGFSTTIQVISSCSVSKSGVFVCVTYVVNNFDVLYCL